jgi:hypothetical protein
MARIPTVSLALAAVFALAYAPAAPAAGAAHVTAMLHSGSRPCGG